MGTPSANPAPPAWRAWLPLLVLPAAVLLFTPADWPRWLFMWLLAFAIFAGCKWLTWRRTPAPGASWRRHLGYLLAWPGLDAPAFLRSESAQQPTRGEWLAAAVKLALGAALVWGVLRLLPAEPDRLRGWVGMVGIVLTLHFGAFHLLSCAWRAAGVEARPLMNAPLLATGVGEFWGRRWNTAFRDLTHRFLFRPLTPLIGPRLAIVAGFVFSGLVHDLVISVPAGAGFGGPTLFFCLQAPAILLERRLGLSGWRGWLFAVLVLGLPAPLLFHAPFVREVVLPFLAAIGAF